jgi:hypothetical protein
VINDNEEWFHYKVYIIKHLYEQMKLEKYREQKWEGRKIENYNPKDWMYDYNGEPKGW